MTDDALTLTVLREIRDEIRTTRSDLNARLDVTNARLDVTNSRFDESNCRLGNLETAMVGLETAMVDLAEQQSFVVRWLKAGTRRDRRIEEDVVKLTTRVDAIEARLPAVEE